MTQIKIYDRGEMLQMYLDWVNNFLTIERFASYYGISESFAEQVIVTGRETLDAQIYGKKFINISRITL